MFPECVRNIDITDLKDPVRYRTIDTFPRRCDVRVPTVMRGYPSRWNRLHESSAYIRYNTTNPRVFDFNYVEFVISNELMR